MQGVLQAEQPLALLLGELGHRHAGPHGDDVGNVGGDHHAVAALVFRSPLVFSALQLVLKLLLLVAEGGGPLEVLGVHSSGLVNLHVLDFLLQLLQIVRGGEGAQPHPGGGLVDEVDSLVGQVAVGNISGGELHGGVNGLVGDGHLVVGLVAVFQALEDFNGLVLAGLPHHDRLEPALQGGVLLNVLAVFVDGGGANDLEVAPGQGGL